MYIYFMPLSHEKILHDLNYLGLFGCRWERSKYLRLFGLYWNPDSWFWSKVVFCSWASNLSPRSTRNVIEQPDFYDWYISYVLWVKSSFNFIIIGGSYYDDVLRYNPYADKWIPVAKLKQARVHHATSVLPLSKVEGFCSR